MKAICSLMGMVFLTASCNIKLETKDEGLVDVDSSAAYGIKANPIKTSDSSSTDRTRMQDTAFIRPSEVVDTRDVQPDAVVAFAKTQIGVPYLYGSTDPAKGFDCSGFITYVFNHFGIAVPRSSRDFTNVGKEVIEQSARPGDLILFTGTDSAETLVGHMGIVVTVPPDTLRFIHSTSGKANGVTITPFNEYYRKRFVKINRVFPDNGSRK